MATIASPRPATVPVPNTRNLKHWLRLHPYAAYALRRVGMYLLTLWGSFTVAFCFFRLIPGDPIQAFIGSLALQYVYNVQAGQAIIDHYREVFGLNGNIFQQYVHYMTQVFVTHDLGPALIDYPEPSVVIIMRALPWTIGLLGMSAIIAWVGGVLLGALIGWRRNAPTSQLLTNVALAFSHVPYYFIALMLIFFVAYKLAWLPAQEAYDAGVPPAISLEFAISLIRHGLLPAISIVFIGVCNWMISTRMLMITTLGEDYLTFADAKGLNPRHILTQYALRNCYLPQVTAFGISLGFIFNGNVLVEQVFNYPGVGSLLIHALGVLDYDTIQGIVALAIFAVLTANLVLDLILPVLDPRVKY